MQRWNDDILLVQPAPEPGLGEEFREVYAMALQKDEAATVIIDLHEIPHLSSSHLSLLLKLRRALVEHNQSLVLCNIPAVLWGVFLVTGLDTVFRFAADVSTALAMVQIQQNQDADDADDEQPN